MEITPTCRGLAELGMEDSNLFNQWHKNCLDHELAILPIAANSFGEKSLSNNCDLPEFNLSHVGIDRPPKHLKSNYSSSWINNSCITDDIANNIQAAFSPNTFPFGATPNHIMNPMANVKPKEACSRSRRSTDQSFPNSDILFSQNYVLKGFYNGQGANKRVSTSSGNRISQAQDDHIMAERKRREKLSQKFIALSALLPGLKKMDKASVLGDAIKHLKQLQEKVKTLEDQARKKSSMESVVFVKKSQLFADIVDFSLDHEDDFRGPFDEPLPEIEARFCDKSVLIRIHCEKRKGLSEKIMSEIEKSHLTVTNSNVITFGTFALDITVVAQMDMEFRMTVKELVKKLRAAF